MCLSFLLFISFFFALNARLQVFRYEFVRLSWGRTIDKLAINWQNFVQVGLQLMCAFRICDVTVRLSIYKQFNFLKNCFPGIQISQFPVNSSN